MYNYLPHPSNMRTSDHVLSMRIQEGAAGYGIYMMLLELLRDAEGRSMVFNPAHLAFAINEPAVDLVERICKNYGLFTIEKDGVMRSPWLDAQMAEYDAKKQAAIEAGRRGAAKRYAKQAAEQEENRDPIGGGKGSLKVPLTNKPNPNIINSDKPNPTESKSKLLDLHVGKWSGEELFLIARQKGTPISELDRQEVVLRIAEFERQNRYDYNPEFILRLCDTMKLSHEQYEVLTMLLDGGKVGTPAMQTAVRIYNEWERKEFRAKYPFEHLVCKLSEV